MSEAATGFGNVTFATFMKNFGSIDNDFGAVLDVYFHACAIRMSCLQLARAAGFPCNDGAHPYTNKQVLTEGQARRVNAQMLTCDNLRCGG